MDAEKIMTFIVGAGSAGTVIGSILLWRLKRTMAHIDEIPSLIIATVSLKQAVDSFGGELKALERSIYQNNKDIANNTSKVVRAHERIDDAKDELRRGRN